MSETVSEPIPVGAADELPALVAQLRQGKIESRMQAAHRLGALGDPRATQALLDSLRGSFYGRSARANLWLGALALLGLIVLSLALIGGWMWAKFGAGWMIFQFFRIPFGYWKGRQDQSRFVAAVTEALVKIAERNPAPEFGTVVEDLKVVATDHLQQTAETRRISQNAAERIEALVGDLRSLPVSADAPSLSGKVLPVPSLTPEPQQDLLPRIGG